MIPTAEIARHLAVAAAPFGHLLGDITAPALLELVRAELGHAEILDGFQPHGAHLAKASAPGTILHVISGNTPHAGLQSLVRGLLIGCPRNLCKLPSGGGESLPELRAFRDALPPMLAERVDFSETLSDDWLARAEAIIVFGSDEAVADLHRRTRPGQKFLAHGNRVSLGLILDPDGDPAGESWAEAARASSLFDQQGCLSPHGFYVRGDAASVRAYAAGLAREMERYNAENPRAALSAGEAAGIRARREDWRFRAANDPARFGLWESARSTAWTVLFDAADAAFAPSPLNRTVFVKPLPEDLCGALTGVKPYLSAIGLWPATRANAEWLAAQGVGASRICPLERMQLPPLTWHQDGAPVLAALVSWVDVEEG